MEREKKHMSNIHDTNLDVIYVTGHRNPDTDSIVSAIAYANLKQKMNINAYPCRLGPINPETQYVLDRWNVKCPMLLQDARSQLDEIEMDKPITLSPETTMFECLQIMKDNKKTTLSVVNHLNQLQGLVTSTNLSDVLMGDTAKSIELLSKTPIEYIAKVIDGRLIYHPEEPHISGKTSIPAISAQGLNNYDLEDRIVIVGNDTQAQLDCIAMNAGLIIVVWASSVAPMVIQAAQEKNCGVIISGHGTMNTSRYLFYASPVKDVMTTDLIVFNKNEFVEDAQAKMIRTRYRSYPVVDNKNHIYGFVSRYHLLNAKKKKIILVDHNEMRQSVNGIESAEIIEIIDHHRIGDISTSRPISFRNEIVGSTATIITKMYYETDIPIEPHIAGLLLAAMISDTLNFKSPTTTNTDVALAQKLALIAEVDIDEYAKDIFNVSNTLKNEKMSDILQYDQKEFDIANKKVIISQMIMYHLNELASVETELETAMEELGHNRRADLVVMIFTSIHENGSVIYASGSLKDQVELAFPNDPGEMNSFQDGVVSRKNQIVPKLTLTLNQMVQ
jgi:manganese-dependent inorganic pyrophosphatase